MQAAEYVIGLLEYSEGSADELFDPDDVPESDAAARDTREADCPAAVV
ncbi:hypothetical protein [Natrinema pallidum]|nr:hypothetical protein [Natrinema pallidum]